MRVELRGIEKSFGAVRVLRGVDLAAAAGEVHALVGGNGAGKSTLMKILEGVHRQDAGDVLLDGDPVQFRSPRDARAAGVSMIFQEFSLVPSLTVAQNVFLQHEPRNGGVWIDDREARRRTREIFADMGVDVDPRRRGDTQPTAYRQLCEIAKALALDARVLIMDEPTASLTRAETASLFQIVARLKERGLAIVYISHRLDEIFQIADRVTVLRDGQVVESAAIGETSLEAVIAAMVGREIEGEMQWQDRGAVERDPLLEVRGMRTADRLSGVDFTVAAGEVVGLAGLMGSGRTEILRAIFGVDRLTAGEILLRGRSLSTRRPSDAVREGIVLVPEDRRQQGLVLDHSIARNLLLPSLGRLASLLGFVDDGEGRRIVDEMRERLAISGGSRSAPVRLLSGGNQQKVVLGKWLATDPAVLLLDEPTAGVDIGTKTEILHMIRALADQGKAIVLVSSETPELLAAADRILIVRDGAVVRSVDRRDVAGEAALEELLQEAA
jgi:ribose transport system ATP-binding protein